MEESEPFHSLGFAAVSWIEHYLIHGPGDVQGQPIELDDEYGAFIVKAYRVDALGQRSVRRAFLSRSKGRAKSELAAMVECFEALGPCRFDHWADAGEVSDWGYEYEPGEPVGAPLVYVEALNVATEESQAGNTYDNVHYMLNAETCTAELLADYGRIDVGLTRINLPGKRGFLEPVTSADSSKDGGKSTFIVADETHLWVLPRLKRLHGVMTRNLLKRKAASGWMLETSTMYGAGEGSVAEGTHAYAKASLVGDNTLLFDHRQASDTWNLDKQSERVKALHEAYGPAASWMNLDAIAESWDDPQVSDRDFCRYWLNQPVALIDVPLVIPNWSDLIATDDPADGSPMRPELSEPPAALAVDMSRDRVVSVGACWRIATGFHVEVAALDRADDTSGVEDWVVETAGRRIPVVIDSMSPANQMIPNLEARKVKVVKAASEGAAMAKACGGFLTDAIEGRLTHAGQDQLDAAVKAATTRPIGKAGGWGWDRRDRDPSQNIAPLVSVTLARFGAATTKPKSTGPKRVVVLS